MRGALWEDIFDPEGPRDVAAPVPCGPSVRRLTHAVLEDAVHILRTGASRNYDRAWEEAAAWVRRTEVHQPFTFVRVCELLGLDPGYLRRGLAPFMARRELGGEGGITWSVRGARRLAASSGE